MEKKSTMSQSHEVSKGNTKILYSQRSRNWCLTDFKFLEWDKIYEENKDCVRYILAGAEICPKTKRPHLQVWMQFYEPRRWAQIRKMIPNTHFEACKGSEIQNDKYCSKDKNLAYKLGKFIGQGHRSDLEHMKYLIYQKKPLLEIAESNLGSYKRYHSGIKDYRSMVMYETTKKFRHVNVEYWHGETGTGKTRGAVEKYPNAYLIKGDSLKWWTNYDMQNELIIDEYNNNVPIETLLGLLDGYQHRLETKGSFTYANWTKIIITSNLNWDQLHENAKPAHKRALRRRINNIVEFKPKIKNIPKKNNMPESDDENETIPDWRNMEMPDNFEDILTERYEPYS